MPIPLKRLRDEHKLDPASLKAAFDQKTIESRPKVKALVKQIHNTIENGIKRNRQDYRLYKAMDWAYDAPFYQVSATQLRGLMSSNPDQKKVMETVNSWGLTHLLPDRLNEDGSTCCDPLTKKPIKELNLPVFFNIFVPVVMAYVTIRWAAIFAQRNLVPLYKYEPVTFTNENRFICEVITQVVQKQSTWFGYPADLKQSILQTLLYGFCINFPREAWHRELQEDESGKPKIVREGLRWEMPHPTRTYYDLYHRLSSLNSNSGCEYAGHWQLVRYRDIHDHPDYWNKDSITQGAVDWFDLANSDFLSQVFPCNMSFPNPNSVVGDLDRQNAAARAYGSGDFDAATLLTSHFQRLIPEQHGLGTYKYPIWMRFLFASDNTVIWAEPLSFSHIPTYTYDADFNRARFRSLALEIMPFQDHISNVLSQWILAAKENLINPVFYDKEKIPATYLKELRDIGQKLYKGRMFVPFSSTQNYRLKQDQHEAFFSPALTHHPTGELNNLIVGILNMLDRVMQLSPQEIGQAAPHEQTAEETRVIAGNTSTRINHTGTGIDDADNAKKTALYDALMANADDNITVGVTSSVATTKEEFDKLLKAVGFQLTDKEAGFDPNKPETMYKVTGNKSKLEIEMFSSTRDNDDRINLPAVADAMSKMFIAISNNPLLVQSIGTTQLVELLNQILNTAGMPQEFRLRGKALEELPQEQQAAAVTETLKGFAEKIQQLVAEKQKETLAAAAQQSQAISQQVSQQVTTQVVGQAMQAAAQQTQAAVAQGVEAAAPQLAEAQRVAQIAAQKLVEHEREIQSLNQAVAQLMQVIQGAVAAQPQPQQGLAPVV